MNNLLHYALNDKRTGAILEVVGGININPFSALQEMIYVNNYFRKTSGRQLRHIIVSPDTDYYYKLQPWDLYHIAIRISQYYSCRYQIVFGVHTDTKNLHIHFIMNTVSYIDGTMYSGGEADMIAFRNIADAVIMDYGDMFNK